MAKDLSVARIGIEKPIKEIRLLPTVAEYRTQSMRRLLPILYFRKVLKFLKEHIRVETKHWKRRLDNLPRITEHHLFVVLSNPINPAIL